MATQGIFSIISNDGKADSMLCTMALEAKRKADLSSNLNFTNESKDMTDNDMQTDSSKLVNQENLDTQRNTIIESLINSVKSTELTVQAYNPSVLNTTFNLLPKLDVNTEPIIKKVKHQTLNVQDIQAAKTLLEKARHETKRAVQHLLHDILDANPSMSYNTLIKHTFQKYNFNADGSRVKDAEGTDLPLVDKKKIRKILKTCMPSRKPKICKCKKKCKCNSVNKGSNRMKQTPIDEEFLKERAVLKASRDTTSPNTTSPNTTSPKKLDLDFDNILVTEYNESDFI